LRDKQKQQGGEEPRRGRLLVPARETTLTGWAREEQEQRDEEARQRRKMERREGEQQEARSNVRERSQRRRSRHATEANSEDEAYAKQETAEWSGEEAPRDCTKCNIGKDSMKHKKAWVQSGGQEGRWTFWWKCACGHKLGPYTREPKTRGATTSGHGDPSTKMLKVKAEPHRD
jgi:hypothetical protein